MAGKTPAVISCSFGGQYGAHNGSQLDERQLSARFAPTVRGRAICIAAGNEGGYTFHGETSFKSKTAPGLIDASGSGIVELFFDTADVKDIRPSRLTATRRSKCFRLIGNRSPIKWRAR